MLYGGATKGNKDKGIKASKEKNSGKIWLEGGELARDKTDIFDMEVTDMLSPLTKIDIGHDNSGPGSGWYLDRVRIQMFYYIYTFGTYIATDHRKQILN